MKPYCHLDLSQRYQIYSLIQLKHKASQIARQLGRDPTTIRREIKRGGGYMKYDPKATHKACKARRKISRKPYKFKGILKERALLLLKLTDAEPAAIGPRLVLEYGPDMQVSTMTLYRYIYRNAACGGKLYTHLRTARKRPKKRKKEKTVRQIIKGRRFIEERPAVVDRVEHLGDLERDTIVGPANKGAIQSIVDRKSSYCWLMQVHSKSAKDTHISTRTLLKH
jgi:IS30 family transposase